jgi:Holliday junction resolvasome RuvABC endonuclease subunit
MIILGLDISSSCTGWAVLKRGRFYKRVDLDYGWIKPKAKLSPAKKLNFFRQELKKIIEIVKPDLIIAEDVFYYKNPKVLKILSRFQGVAMESIYNDFEIEIFTVAVTELRSIFGTQAKENIFNIIKEKFKLDPTWEFSEYNDITDAIAVSYFAYKSKLENSENEK